MKMESFGYQKNEREQLLSRLRDYAEEHGIEGLEFDILDEGDTFSFTFGYQGQEVVFEKIDKNDAAVAGLGLLEGFLQNVGVTESEGA